MLSITMTNNCFLSFFLQWESSSELQHQALQITLQKPLIVAELGFLIDITRFVMPTFSFVKSNPVPHATYDLILQGEYSGFHKSRDYVLGLPSNTPLIHKFAPPEKTINIKQ